MELRRLHLVATELVESQLGRVKNGLNAFVEMIIEDVGQDLGLLIATLEETYRNGKGQHHKELETIIPEAMKSAVSSLHFAFCIVPFSNRINITVSLQ